MCDAVANQLAIETELISVEMIYRGFYHFHQARTKGRVTNPLTYFAVPENQDLGIVKRIPKSRQKPFPKVGQQIG